MPRQNFVHRTYILIKCDKPVLNVYFHKVQLNNNDSFRIEVACMTTLDYL